MATSQTNPTSTPKFSPILETFAISTGYICGAGPGRVSGWPDRLSFFDGGGNKRENGLSVISP
jgi:hypothetical protein